MKTFHFNNLDSPTQYNLQQHLRELDYQPSQNPSTANLTDHNITMPEHLAQHLEFKHKLAALVNQHCPQVMPITYCIDDHNYPQILQQIAEHHDDQFTWIIKPALINNGRGICIYQHLSELQTHFLSPKRLGGAHVIQQYIEQPHLLNGHKYSFRLFVIISNYAGAYLYHQGYFNVAKTPYPQQPDFSQLQPHLTNEHLTEIQPNVIQIPTTQCEHFDVIYNKMKNITEKITNAFYQTQHFQKTNSTPAIIDFFGFDFMLDKTLRPWLLEINHRPCFPKSSQHSLYNHLYHPFWQDVIRDFIIPISKNQNQFPQNNSQHFKKCN